MRRFARTLLAAGVATATVPSTPATAAVRLRQQTVQDFERYAESAETQFERRLSGEDPFLWSMERPERKRALMGEEIVVEPSAESTPISVHRGLVHDWTAAVLVPGARSGNVFDVIVSYDTHAETYAPSIVRSRIVERDGTMLRVAIRLLRQSFMTAVLDTEHVAEYDRLDDARRWGRSRTVSVREVVDPGTPEETLRPEGFDNGYLWRMNTYWRFAEIDEGVVAEYRVVTLTRNIPRLLRWVLRPVLTSLPKQSLRDSMRITREAALEAGL